MCGWRVDAIPLAGAGRGVDRNTELLEQLVLATSLPDVVVKEWLHPGDGKCVRLLPSFDAFLKSACDHVGVTSPAKLYLLPNSNDLSSRRILDRGMFNEFCRKCQIQGAPTVYVFGYTTDATAKGVKVPSPDKLPGFDEETPADRPRRPTGSGVSPGSSRSRDSQQQRGFRFACTLRDGERCVLCERGSGYALEAAHIVPQGTKDTDVLRAAGLFTPWDVRNGIMLCKECHVMFDFPNFLWCVRPGGKVEIAKALTEDEKFSERFGPLNGKVFAGKEGWPAEKTWQFQANLFDAAAAERAASREEKPYSCATCGNRFKTAVTLLNHLSRDRGRKACGNAVGSGKRVFHTPGKATAPLDSVAETPEKENGGKRRRRRKHRPRK
jgi:hypothetical protein